MESEASKIQKEKILDQYLTEVVLNASQKITSEADLKQREAEQRIEHRERRLQMEIERKQDEIEELQTDRELKKKVANIVFYFLAIETTLVFIILCLQGFGFWGFYVSDTTLNIFLPATIIQISSMAIIITKYLFTRK